VTEKQRVNLKEYSGDDQVISSHEMKLTLDRKRKAAFKVKAGIPSFDRYMGGFEGGELIGVSGPTKQGKTLLCQSLTVNFCEQNHFPLWFTFEVPAHQFLSQFPDLPMIYMPKKLKHHALDWLEDRIVESFEKYRTRIIFIDHLHYLLDMARAKSISIDIGVVVRRLKGIAVEREMVIFLLCHTIKGKQEAGAGLSYDSIRDSSFISQESDSIIMIKRTHHEGENTARARIEFHRRTGVLEKTVDLIKHEGLLREVTNADA